MNLLNCTTLVLMHFSKLEPLPDAKRKDFQPLMDVFGERTILCLCSKSWNLRENSIKQVLESLSALDMDDNVLRCCCKVLEKGLSDKIIQVYYASLGLLKVLVGEYSKPFKRSTMHPTLGPLIATLVEKIGDTNPKTKALTSEAILHLASHQNVGANFVGSLLSKRAKPQAWRLIIGKLELLRNIIEQYGILEDGGPRESLLGFVVENFNNPNADVRNEAMKTMIEIHRLDKALALKYLANVKGKIRETYDEKFAEYKPEKSNQLVINR
jgi:hypothetical protein